MGSLYTTIKSYYRLFWHKQHRNCFFWPNTRCLPSEHRINSNPGISGTCATIYRIEDSTPLVRNDVKLPNYDFSYAFPQNLTPLFNSNSSLDTRLRMTNPQKTSKYRNSKNNIYDQHAEPDTDSTRCTIIGDSTPHPSTFSPTPFPRLDPLIYNVYTAYKPVARKIKPVPATFPEEARVTRQFPEDPLLSLPPLSPHPPDFTPTTKLTQERLTIFKINKSGFLWPEEEKLFAQIFKQNEDGLAYNDAERGTLRSEYFSDYIIPTVEHIPWSSKPIPIPPALMPQIIDGIKAKIAAGVFERSQASYRSAAFYVRKKDGGIRHIIDLQPLNAVTIRDAGLPPVIDSFVEPFAGCSVYTTFDLYSGYDARIIHPKSRDLTSFHTPLGLLRYRCLPMGYTNSIAEFQNCTSFILQHEMPQHANILIDDLGIKGPPTRYEKEDGSFETIPENPGIRRFIWEHAVTVNRILHRLKHAGATISPKKSQVAQPDVILAGQKLTYEGRLPDDSRVSKILKWPPLKTITQVRGFLGTCGTVRIWIQDYTLLIRPLTELTRKNIPFIWDDRRHEAFEYIKQVVANCPALIPIDYASELPVIFAVDTSNIAIGFIIFQLDKVNKRRPVRFGSLPINDRESRYSQAKLELFGLYRALRHSRYHLTGVKNLVVEVDAKYIKDMINKPDLQPNATLNRWIAGILLFSFKLVHVPAARHKGPDGLSRREPADDDTEIEDDDDDDEEDWTHETLTLFKRYPPDPADNSLITITPPIPSNNLKSSHLSNSLLFPTDTYQYYDEYLLGPTSNQSSRRRIFEVFDIKRRRTSDDYLIEIRDFLTNLKIPNHSTPGQRQAFLNRTKKYYVRHGKLWRRSSNIKPPVQVILDQAKRRSILELSHDKLGHRGVYPTARTISLRFWWPSYFSDVQEFVKTCHPCQIRSTLKLHLPITPDFPTTVFTKLYLDIMLMPKGKNGYRYIVAA